MKLMGQMITILSLLIMGVLRFSEPNFKPPSIVSVVPLVLMCVLFTDTLVAMLMGRFIPVQSGLFSHLFLMDMRIIRNYHMLHPYVVPVQKHVQYRFHYRNI